MCKEGTVSKTTPGGGREAGRRRKGKSKRTDDVKISSGVCDRAIETEREGEIVWKAETRQRRRNRQGGG